MKIVMDMKNNILIKRLNNLSFNNQTNREFKNIDLYKLFTKKEVLIAAYENIKSNQKATPIAFTLSSSSLNKIEKLQKALKNESWKPKPPKKIFIPLENGQKQYSNLFSLEDKIVQTVVLNILESIYKPRFSPNSYGYNGEEIHDCLKFININYDGVIWALEGQIQDLYENVDHHLFVDLLKKYVEDDRFIRLIWKLLRTGETREKGKTLVGIPKSFISPILANIYLHNLDTFIEDFCKRKAEKRSSNIKTPVYKRIYSQKQKIVRELTKKVTEETRKNLISNYKDLKKKSLSIRMYTKGSDRILYTRYKENFIIGIAGSKALSSEIKEDIEKELDILKLKSSKLEIIPLRKENLTFLGHRIGINTAVKVAKVHVKHKTPFTRRVTGKFVLITAPTDDIVLKLHEKGFCDRKGFPTHKTSLLTFKDYQIVDLFNYSILGLFGYYSGVDKKHTLTRIWYIFKFSCAMTLGAKHSCSLNKIFEKHGRNLKVIYGEKGEKHTRLYQPDFKKRSKVWQTGKILPKPYR